MFVLEKFKNDQISKIYSEEFILNRYHENIKASLRYSSRLYSREQICLLKLISFLFKRSYQEVKLNFGIGYEVPEHVFDDLFTVIPNFLFFSFSSHVCMSYFIKDNKTNQ